jgi:soluble lytic murein transglycosylase-like protein
VIYEETYFRPWKKGKDGEIGLMQVTPAVGRDWARETGMDEFERQMASDPESLLRDPHRNIQIGSWYLEKFHETYRDLPDAEARMLAAFNAGPTRAADSAGARLIECGDTGDDGQLPGLVLYAVQLRPKRFHRLAELLVRDLKIAVLATET